MGEWFLKFVTSSDCTSLYGHLTAFREFKVWSMSTVQVHKCRFFLFCVVCLFALGENIV